MTSTAGNIDPTADETLRTWCFPSSTGQRREARLTKPTAAGTVGVCASAACWCAGVVARVRVYIRRGVRAATPRVYRVLDRAVELGSTYSAGRSRESGRVRAREPRDCLCAVRRCRTPGLSGTPGRSSERECYVGCEVWWLVDRTSQCAPRARVGVPTLLVLRALHTVMCVPVSVCSPCIVSTVVPCPLKGTRGVLGCACGLVLCEPL